MRSINSEHACIYFTITKACSRILTYMYSRTVNGFKNNNNNNNSHENSLVLKNLLSN